MRTNGGVPWGDVCAMGRCMYHGAMHVPWGDACAVGRCRCRGVMYVPKGDVCAMGRCGVMGDVLQALCYAMCRAMRHAVSLRAGPCRERTEFAFPNAPRLDQPVALTVRL